MLVDGLEIVIGTGVRISPLDFFYDGESNEWFLMEGNRIWRIE